jgi:mannose/fructose-specific phosphotransferase system component IIA
MSDAVRGILVTHGAMAQGMVDAVVGISGVESGALVAVSNHGRSPEELQAAIRAELSAGEGPVVVFTDLGAGSCTLAARLSCRERRRVAVLTGVNLPMLLDFVFHREMALDELTDRLADKARSGVKVLPTG